MDVKNQSLEERGKLAGKEIAEILKKYNLGLSVDIHMAQDFINSLKPILIDAIPEEENAK